ncbi:DUF805 domain-containing protein, partial [Staphylococcus aureus]|nr:hypothetical protein [Staphylococcus aureus]
IFSIIVLFTLAIIIPSLALTVRRFRDAGLKTWAIWTLIGVNWLFSGADSVQNFTSDGRAFSVLSFIISVLMFIISVLATNTLSQMGGIGNGQEDAPVEVAPVSAETTTDSIAEAESESVQSEMTSEINRVEKDNEI